MVVEVFDIRVAAQEPEQFVDDGFEVQFFRGEHRKTLAQIEPRLRTEYGISARARAVGLKFAMFKDLPQQIEVLNHSGKNLTAECAKYTKRNLSAGKIF
jgi:hypothetical protein